MKNNATLVLVDGSSYLYRAYHAMPALTNSAGEPTGAIYGFINMLRRLLKDYSPSYVAIVFDAKGKTFRDDLYPQYKANRAPMPDELRAQIEPVHQVIQAMGFPIIVVDGVEADDVIGSLATQASNNEMNTIISTGDKDFAQLVSDQVSLVNTMTETTMDVQGVNQKFGIEPSQIIDYLALIGDSVDNIPGVPKVGPKTAVKWLGLYGSLQGVIEHANEIKGKVGENLREFLDQLPLSYQLATIKCDLVLAQAPHELRLGEPNHGQLKEMFKRFEFKTWLRELLEKNQQNDSLTGVAATEFTSSRSGNYDMVLTEEKFAEWLAKLQQVSVFAFDTETTSLDYMQADIVGVSFAVNPYEAAYVPFLHDYPEAPKQLSRDHVLAQLKPLLESQASLKIGQNIKYDMSVLARHGIHLQGIKYDTMLESYVLNSVGTRHDMDSLAMKYLAHHTIHFEEIAGKGVKQVTFDKIDLAQAAPYAAEDADVTLRLHEVLWQKLSETPALVQVFEDIEMPLVPVLSAIERNGVRVDGDLLKLQSKELQGKLEILEQQAYEMAGETFNLASPKQIQHIFYDKLQLPILRKTPKGQPSTAENVLQELALDYPLPQLILEHRSLSKLKTTYTDKLPDQIDEYTGRVHTSYHQAVAATGRLSSTDPNLQNIPVRNDEGRRIRQAFIAPPGFKMVSADYSQIELRIMAHISGDERLVDAFQQGADIHRATAAEILGLAPEAVTSEQRRHAKAINFGLIYGMSAFGLARQLGVTRPVAQDYINLYFERYPGVKNYMEQIKQNAQAQGFVETLFGRRLYLPDIHSSNAQRRQYAERTAINAPMQGSAADIIKKAMIATHAWLVQSQSPVTLIMQVHDELVFEVPTELLAASCTQIRTLMEGAARLSVPLLVEVGSGNNWDEAH